MLLPEKEDRYANRIRNRGDGNDFYRETQRAWHVDDRIDGEKNCGHRDSGATDCRNAQPDRSAGTNRACAKDRYREHYEIDDAVENIRGVIDELKRFLNPGADLAGDGDHQCDCADKNDRVNWRFVSRMQAREPTREQVVPARDHWETRAASYVNAGRSNCSCRH